MRKSRFSEAQIVMVHNRGRISDMHVFLDLALSLRHSRRLGYRYPDEPGNSSVITLWMPGNT